MSLQVIEGTGAKARIAKALANLAIARQVEFTDESQRVYLHLLADLDAALVAKACEQFAARPRGEFAAAMPSVGDIREAIEDLRRQEALQQSKALALPSHELDGRTYACFQCQDDPAGWILLRCPATRCDRHAPHYAHSFTVRCPHWLRQHEAAIRDSARQAIEKHKDASAEFDALVALTAGRYRYSQAVTL